MKERCLDCLDIFEKDELSMCICSDFMGGWSPKRAIPTKYGVVEEKIPFFYCKDCLAMKHTHDGEAFI